MSAAESMLDPTALMVHSFTKEHREVEYAAPNGLPEVRLEAGVRITVTALNVRLRRSEPGLWAIDRLLVTGLVKGAERKYGFRVRADGTWAHEPPPWIRRWAERQRDIA